MRAEGLPDDFCELLDRWRVAEWPESQEVEVETEREHRERPTSILWGGFGGSIVLPHGRFPVLRALTLGYLCRKPHTANRWLEMLTDHLSRNETVVAWQAMCLFFRNLRCCSDRTQVGDFLTRLFEAYPAILRSEIGVRGLAEVEGLLLPPARERAFAAVRDWPGGFGPRAFGEVVALRILRNPDESWTAEIVGKCFTGELGSDTSEILIGVAHAAANTWLEPNARAIASKLLLRLFERPEPEVVWAAGTVFRRNRVFPTDDCTRALFRQIADRPEILDHLDSPDGLFEHLLDLFTDDPDVVCRIAEAFVEQAGDKLRTMSSNAFMATAHLIDAAIRLQRLQEYRSRGLALFEALLDLGVNEAAQTLRENDHRLGGTHRLQRRRRTADDEVDDVGDDE